MLYYINKRQNKILKFLKKIDVYINYFKTIQYVVYYLYIYAMYYFKYLKINIIFSFVANNIFYHCNILNLK